MKRETIRHPKTYDLAARLGIGRDTALGKLTLLWDYCGEVAPRGDIGKWSDAVIAQACDWTGEAGVFVNALIESRWLDRVGDDCRLIVHDWPDHCEGWVKKKLERALQSFLPHYSKDTVQTPSGQRRDVFDPSNPIQSNPKGLSMSIDEVDDDADENSISDDDWDAVTTEVRRIAKVVPIKNQEDCDLLFKVAVLHRKRMPEAWLSGPLGVLRNKRRVGNKAAYLQTALKRNSEKLGLDFNGLLRRVVIPPEIMRPPNPTAKATA